MRCLNSGAMKPSCGRNFKTDSGFNQPLAVLMLRRSRKQL